MVNFNSLPRELRDQIYRQVLVNPFPIEFSNVLGPMIYDPDLLGPMAMLFDWASDHQIAHEACEIFYQCNTFLLHCEDLPTFLGAKIHKTLSVDVGQFVHKQEPSCLRSFDTKEWVTDMNVIIEPDDIEHHRNLSQELQYLFECPRLRKLTFKIGLTIAIFWEKDWTDVLSKFQSKLGEGFSVSYVGVDLERKGFLGTSLG